MLGPATLRRRAFFYPLQRIITGFVYLTRVFVVIVGNSPIIPLPCSLLDNTNIIGPRTSRPKRGNKEIPEAQAQNRGPLAETNN